MKRKFGEKSVNSAVADADYHAKLEARRRDPGQTQSLVCRGAGDHPPGLHPPSEIVWYPGDYESGPRPCRWETNSRRCRMVGTESDYCPFHRQCLNNGWDRPTMQDFAEWLAESERWRGDLQFLWGRLTGEIWLIPVGPVESASEPIGAPKTKAEAMDLAAALARGAMCGRAGVVSELRKMANKYPGNAAWYNREANRMEGEIESDGTKEVQQVQGG